MSKDSSSFGVDGSPSPSLDGPSYGSKTINMTKLAERAKWIPMRLRAEERVLLKLLEGGLEVSFRSPDGAE